MNNDFLVYWVHQEYFPNGTEYDGGEWSGDFIYETVFAIMRGDESLQMEEICVVEAIADDVFKGLVYPVSIGNDLDYSYNQLDPMYAVIGEDNAIVAVHDEASPNPEYDTIQVALINKAEKTLDIVIEDLVLSSLLLVGFDATVAIDNRVELFSGFNNSFVKDGERFAWFGVEVEVGSVKQLHYLSISTITGALSVITDVGSAGIHRIQLMTGNLIAYHSGGGYADAPALYLRGESNPVPLVDGRGYAAIVAVSDDETKAVSRYKNPEISGTIFTLHDLTSEGNDIEITLGKESQREYGFVAMNFYTGVIAVRLNNYTTHGERRVINITCATMSFYDPQHQVLGEYTSTPHPEGSWDPDAPAPSGFFGMRPEAFVYDWQRERLVDGSPLGFPSIISQDGTYIKMEEKHPWIINSGVELGFLGMWTGSFGPVVPKNFWTAFQYTQETI